MASSIIKLELQNKRNKWGDNSRTKIVECNCHVDMTAPKVAIWMGVLWRVNPSRESLILCKYSSWLHAYINYHRSDTISLNAFQMFSIFNPVLSLFKLYLLFWRHAQGIVTDVHYNLSGIITYDVSRLVSFGCNMSNQ